MPDHQKDYLPKPKDILGELALVKDFYHKLDWLRISGLEVTQATQHYQAAEHLTDPADRGPDNSIRLVAGKPAWVRVYLSSLMGAGGITGTLEIQRRQLGFMWNPVATLNPTPPVPAAVPSVLQADYATTRGSLGQTLNFIIPAETMIGALRLIARVSAGSNHAEFTTTVEVTLRQTLRLAGVMIEYDGPASSAANAPNLQIAAPTLANLQAMAARTLTLFPVQSTAEFRAAGTLTLTHHLQDTSFPASGCGDGWNALLAAVANARTADGNQAGWIYYGLLPAGVPMGPVIGCGGGGLAVGPVNQPGTLAHEAGHAAGLGHAPAGGAPNPDPNYPAYEPYDPAGTPQGSIGEYGLDINNGNIASPQTFRDFMAYGGPSWISPYHHGKLLNNASLNPVTVGIDFPWWKDLVWEEYRKWPWVPFQEKPDLPPLHWELPMFPPFYPKQNVISLIVRVERGAVAEVMHVARTRVQIMIEGERSPLVACLRGSKGEILAQAPMVRLPRKVSVGCGAPEGEPSDSASYVAQAFIPDVGNGAALEIGDGTNVLWQRKAPKEPAAIREFTAELTGRGKLSVRLQWKVSGPVQELWLRWSSDRDQENWRALSTGLTGNSARIDPGLLPPGEVLLQLVAHDGFFSSYSKTVRIKMPQRPPEVSIYHPVDGHTYAADQPLRLWGAATAADEKAGPDDSVVWLLGGREIGQGLESWISLKPGKHTLTLRMKTAGGVSEASVRIRVVRPGEAGNRPEDIRK